jgi:hypothetical protein
LQEQKGSGTDSVNVQRAGGLVDDDPDTGLSAIPLPSGVATLFRQSAMNQRLPVASAAVAHEECRPLQKPRLQFASFHFRATFFFARLSGIFPWLETHLTNPGAGWARSLA